MEKGIQLDAIVRAVWKVSGVRFIGPARSVAGAVKAVLEFDAELESGNRNCSVTVEVTLAALNRLREKLDYVEKVGFPGWSEHGDVDKETLAEVVKEFLALQPSFGGRELLGSDSISQAGVDGTGDRLSTARQRNVCPTQGCDRRFL